MDVAPETFQLPQFGPIKRRADAELAYRAIDTSLTNCLACHEGNLHASLQMAPASTKSWRACGSTAS
jgi:hypothetical protein